MDLEQIFISFFKDVGIDIENMSSLEGTIIYRDTLLDIKIYEKCIEHISIFKKIFSSSYMTCLQSTADTNQKYPLINLVRQILKGINYDLVPKRISDGYTIDKKKKFNRLFIITKVKKI